MRRGRRVNRVLRDTYLGCPLTRNRSPWCFRMCVPVNGLGKCGRLAPHALKGRIQRGIDRHKAAQRARVDVPVPIDG